jgi:TorA maturation chaperone TorD
MKKNDATALQKKLLLAEALVFGLLGRILYNQPNRDWLNSLINEDVFSEVPFGADQKATQQGQELLLKWVGNNPKGLSEEAFKDLNADHTRLLVGAGKVLAPPWESVFFTEDRLVFQEQTLEVRNWYRRFGLELENLHKEPDDHIGLEITFIAYMAELGIQVLEEGDDSKFQRLTEEKRKFLSEHLLKWGPEWCALVVEHAKTDFYRGLGYLTSGVLNAIAEQYEIQTPKEDAK